MKRIGKGTLVKWEPGGGAKGYCICKITDLDPPNFKDWDRKVMRGVLLNKRSSACNYSEGDTWAFYADQITLLRQLYNKKRAAL